MPSLWSDYLVSVNPVVILDLGLPLWSDYLVPVNPVVILGLPVWSDYLVPVNPVVILDLGLLFVVVPFVALKHLLTEHSLYI